MLDQELISLDVGLCSPNFAQRWGTVFWNQRMQTAAADQAPNTDLRYRFRFLAQPLRCLRTSRVIFYKNNQSVLKCTEHKQSRTIDQSIDLSIVLLRRLQVSKKGRLCSGFAYGCHWDNLGAAFATRPSFSRLSQINWLIIRFFILKFWRFIFESWSDRFSQRVAGPRASVRTLRRILAF